MDQRNPLDLMLIRFRNSEPEPVKAEAWDALVDSIRQHGIREPLDGTKNGLVIHGRRRWLAARALKLTSVPYIVHDEAEAPIIHMENLMLREHLTKEAAFYKFIPCLDDFMKASNDRRLKNLQKSPVFSMSRTATSETHQTLQLTLGLSKDTYFRVIRVWNLFRNPDCRVLADFYRTSNLSCPSLERLRKMQVEFREELEPKFLSGEKSAWNVISFVGGALPELQARKTDNQLTFWQEPFKGLRNAVPAWRKLPADTRQSVLESWAETLEALPAEFWEVIEKVADKR